VGEVGWCTADYTLFELIPTNKQIWT
jgi:hypothetical protein